MMLGNYNPGPDTPPPPEEEESGSPAPLLSKILYVWAGLNFAGSILLLGFGEGAYAFWGFLGTLFLIAVAMYLHDQAANSQEMVRLLKEQNERKRH